MSKGYSDKPIKALKTKQPKLNPFGVATGLALGVVTVITLEAAVVWVILAYLLKVKLGFTQVLAVVMLLEYALGRVKMKNVS